jgi:hypothetical protein
VGRLADVFDLPGTLDEPQRLDDAGAVRQRTGPERRLEPARRLEREGRRRCLEGQAPAGELALGECLSSRLDRVSGIRKRHDVLQPGLGPDAGSHVLPDHDKGPLVHRHHQQLKAEMAGRLVPGQVVEGLRGGKDAGVQAARLESLTNPPDSLLELGPGKGQARNRVGRHRLLLPGGYRGGVQTEGSVMP